MLILELQTSVLQCQKAFELAKRHLKKREKRQGKVKSPSSRGASCQDYILFNSGTFSLARFGVYKLFQIVALRDNCLWIHVYAQSTIYWDGWSHKHQITFGEFNKNYLRNIVPKKNVVVQLDFQGPFGKKAFLNLFYF